MKIAIGVWLALAAVSLQVSLGNWKVARKNVVMGTEGMSVTALVANSGVGSAAASGFVKMLFGDKKEKLMRRLTQVKEDIGHLNLRIGIKQEEADDIAATKEKIDGLNSQVACWDGAIHSLLNDRIDQLKKLEGWITAQ